MDYCANKPDRHFDHIMALHLEDKNLMGLIRRLVGIVNQHTDQFNDIDDKVAEVLNDIQFVNKLLNDVKSLQLVVNNLKEVVESGGNASNGSAVQEIVDTVNDIQQTINNLQSTIRQIERDVNNYNDIVEDVTNTVENIQRTVNNNSTEVNNLRQSVTNVTNRVDQIIETGNSYDDSALVAQINGALSRLSSVENSLVGLGASVDNYSTLNTIVDGQQTRISNLEQENANLKQRVLALESNNPQGGGETPNCILDVDKAMLYIPNCVTGTVE